MTGVVLGQQLALLQELLRFGEESNGQDYSLNAGRIGTHEADPRAGIENECILENPGRRRKQSAPLAPRLL